MEILLVEDDHALAGSLGDYLSEFGYDVDYARDGRSCLERARQQAYDLIVMDVAMPRMSGFDTCRQLRRECNETPILFLTARDALPDKEEGYAAGGDDYLVKPFEPQELIWRIRALMRRMAPRQPRSPRQVGDLIIDPASQSLSHHGVVSVLPALQFTLLNLLADEAPEPVSRRKLEAALWPEGDPPDSDALRTYIYRLRQTLGKPYGTDLIRTVHGKGYRLAIPH
ncbi:response regulator transcription factor [Pseudomonas sp. Marseille-Q1929]|uniref:response regulator transcription factor n=1 Tax=Pseudomonas sp. Marseille-Q1929 TaxID=2730402 RepID=UPI001A8FB5EB|nr:response regulator transcription factor [Pseudomonas sp. Marseille-Q1929]MBO0491532.1 response regulator transcription factor [Pseudomonas sp. Marseille-Q1929]